MSSQNSEVLFNNIKKIYDAGHSYHTLQFPNGLVIEGKWDMAKYLHHYKIPEDLSRKYLGFYWKPNMKYFEKIAEYAGFSKVEQISKFWVKRKGFMDSFLGVIHCYT